MRCGGGEVKFYKCPSHILTYSDSSLFVTFVSIQSNTKSHTYTHFSYCLLLQPLSLINFDMRENMVIAHFWIDMRWQATLRDIYIWWNYGMNIYLYSHREDWGSYTFILFKTINDHNHFCFMLFSILSICLLVTHFSSGCSDNISINLYIPIQHWHNWVYFS